MTIPTQLELTLQSLARAGAPSVVAPPLLAERVLRRRRPSWLRRGSVALLAGGLLVGGAVAARSDGHARFFETYQPSGGMAPTVAIGERLVSDRTLTPTYGDVAVFLHPLGAGREALARRVIGLPGDTVACPGAADGRCAAWTRNGIPLAEPYATGEDGTVHPAVTLGVGEVFVLGDRRDIAVDSRQVGPFPASELRGVGVQVRGSSGARPVLGAPAHEGPGASVDRDDQLPSSQVDVPD